MLMFAYFLMTFFTLLNGFGFIKKKKEEKPDSKQMSCSAPNRVTTSRNGKSSKDRSTDSVDGGNSSKMADEAEGSPASKTQPIAIHSSRQRSTNMKSRTSSAYSLHSTTSFGSGGSSRRHGHGTPNSGGRSVIGSFLSGSAGSGPSTTPMSYSKSHEAIWGQAFRNSCR